MTVQVGGVTTGASGTNAKIDTVTSGNTVTLNFTIPRGADAVANLADETPQPLGAASAGSAFRASRADHVHATPLIAFSALTGIPATFTPSTHLHTINDIVSLQTALDTKQPAGSYATLVNGTVPSSMLPSFVDDIIEYATLSAFPATNDVGKIYTAVDTRKIYRWSGTGYVEISPSPGTTTDVPEGSNLYHTTARAAAAAPVQSVAGRVGAVVVSKSDVGLGSVPNVDATVRSNHTGTQTASTISDFAVEAAKYGPVTSVSGRTGAITLAQLGSSGTASASTFLRGDGQWTAAGGGNTFEAANVTGFPVTGASGTIYIATDASRMFRWSGSVYVEMGSGQATPVVGDPPPAPTTDPNFSSVTFLLHADGSGSTFIDSSLAANQITAISATQSDAESKWGGKSAYFNGSSRLEASGASFAFGSGDFTVELWLYHQGAASQINIFDTNNGGSGFSLYKYAEDNVLRIFVHDITQTVINGGSVPPNAWHYIAITRVSGTMRLYIDGFQSGASYSSSQNWTDGRLVIGRFMSGYIDDVRITKGIARTITKPTAAFPDS
jgi:hypothetical protein